MQILIVCTSRKTWDNVLSHFQDCHNLGAGSVCWEGCGGVCWNSGEGGGQCKRWSLQILDLQRLTSLLLYPQIFLCFWLSQIFWLIRILLRNFWPLMFFIGLCLGLQQLWTNWSWNYQQSDCTQKNQLSNNRCDKRQYNVFKFISVHVYLQYQVQINMKNLHYMLKKRSSIVKPFVGQ